MTQHSRAASAFSAVFIIIVATAGCHSSPDSRRNRRTGDDDASDRVPASTSSDLERCEGYFACTLYWDGNAETAKGDLIRRGEDCWWRNPAGTPSVDLSSPGVTLYDDHFSFTETSGDVVIFVECLPIAGRSASAGAGTCGGSATSCSAMSFVDCTAQRGCSSNIGDAFSASDDRCAGSAEHCDRFENQGDCEHQRGCAWTD
jgi:hypothetical protein